MVTEPIHNNNRAREDDEAGPDTIGMTGADTESTVCLCISLQLTYVVYELVETQPPVY